MYTKRISPCLDVHNGRVVKGINFVSHEINYIYSTKRYIKDDFDLKDGSFNNYDSPLLL